MSPPHKLSHFRLNIHDVFSNPQIFNDSSTGCDFSVLHQPSSPPLNSLDMANVCGGLTSTASADSGTVKVVLLSTAYWLMLNVFQVLGAHDFTS